MSSSDVFGLAPVDTPTVEQGSVLVEWLYNGEHGDTHECPRRQDRGQEQLVEFLESGQVRSTRCGCNRRSFVAGAKHVSRTVCLRTLWLSLQHLLAQRGRRT
mmetsp:Transcript_24621/g.53299  ORF Transcript_24621/g.53299 Transcript_24621/m.53299 type:complete len:102 (-) Transcript_24621:149-454(-)